MKVTSYIQFLGVILAATTLATLASAENALKRASPNAQAGMRKTSLLGGLALAAALVASPAAAETPTSKESCQDLLEDVQAVVAEKNMSPDERANIGKMVENLSQQCSEGQYLDAANTAKTIRELIAKN